MASHQMPPGHGAPRVGQSPSINLSPSAEQDAKRRAPDPLILQLKRQDVCLRLAGGLAKLGGWEIDVLTEEVFWSDEVWTLLSGSPRPICLEEAMSIYPPHERPRVEALLSRACLEGEPVTFESEIVRFDGSRAWIRASGEPEIVDGVCVALRGAAQEISDARALLLASERAERRLNLAMQLAEMHVYEIDFVARTVVAQGAQDTFFENGLSIEAIQEDPFFVVHPEDRASVDAAWAKSQAEGAPFRTEHRVRRSDGSEVWAYTTAELFSDEQGRPLRVVGAMTNITNRKLAERELVAALEAAQTANEVKSAFLANMSHEIRSPLNGIVAGADMLSRRELDPQSRKLVDVIASSCVSFERVLSDILDLARIDAGEVTITPSDFHLGELLRSALALVQSRADEKGIALIADLAPEIDVVVRGDPARIRQVLLNVLNNAVKFTDAGQVTVGAKRYSGSFFINVQDTGIGFGADFGNKLFGRFEQADGSITRRFGGLGLGLNITRRLVELMGGQIGAESTVGEGSIFWIDLPLPEANGRAAEREAAAHAESQRLLRILLADDHPTNRLVVEMMLEDLAEVTSVTNGAEAVEAFSAGSFDVVLMDMQMPVMDGLTAVRAIRAWEGGRQAATPIVMMTANALPEHKAASLAAGADLHLAKPITFANLVSAMDSVLPAAAEYPEP